ncbi:MAG: 2-oxoglutarate dehydrogenase complex dihydrolipoyllysine-residue succinyltransferase [Immundisolibacterales bacterium]|nr:2-oxoglutarate dehydrogenase complex dihydrolipoyllysine-residue succinyltransferase [Immundisolibacterales bacterium]
MLIEVRIPTLAESVPDAKLLAWNYRAGDRVERGDVLIELETDKVVLEVPAPEDGTVSEIVLAEGETGESGQLLARIETEAGASGAAREAGSGRDPDASGAGRRKEEHRAAPAEIAMGPAARRAIAEHGLDPAAIAGTGRDGRITKADVLRHLEQARADGAATPSSATPTAAPATVRSEPEPSSESAPPAVSGATPVREMPSDAAATGARAERREPMSRLRQRVAERLLDAQRRAAILSTFNEVDMQPVMDLRRRYREDFERRHGVRLGFMSFFVKAAVQALERYPLVNACIDGDDIVHHDYCDIGVAVGSPRGLVVPVLRNAERLSFAQVERAIAGYGERARDGSLAIEDLVGGTFTISNGGVFGSLLSTPILNPPQSAILGMHKTQPRPVVDEQGEVVVRPMMYVALSYDHRIIDGREAVGFLVTIKEAVEDPARLLLEV